MKINKLIVLFVLGSLVSCSNKSDEQELNNIETSETSEISETSDTSNTSDTNVITIEDNPVIVIETPSPIIEAPPVLVKEPLISPESRQMIIYFEVSSRERYERLYSRPICPLCLTTYSGVTIGIGWDLRHQPPFVTTSAWARHPNVSELPRAYNVGGQAAIDLTRQMQHIITPYELAEQVYDETMVVQYYRLASRTFGPNFVSLNPHARGCLVSVVINRGGSLANVDSRREMRNIAHIHMPNMNLDGIATEIRNMKRLWNDVGLKRRRDIEADMCLRPWSST